MLHTRLEYRGSGWIYQVLGMYFGHLGRLVGDL